MLQQLATAEISAWMLVIIITKNMWLLISGATVNGKQIAIQPGDLVMLGYTLAKHLVKVQLVIFEAELLPPQPVANSRGTAEEKGK